MKWWKWWRLYRMIFKERSNCDLDEIQNQGLLSIKIAQLFALRIDWLDVDTCLHLAKLYESANSLSTEDAKKRLDSLASKGLVNELVSFESEPLASASIGQVHAGELKDGAQIVIKFTKTDQNESFKRDLKSLRRLLKTMIFFYPKLAGLADPIGTLDIIQRSTLNEMDLRKEILGQKKLHEAYLRLEKTLSERNLLQGAGLSFPKIYEDLSNENVLVMEHLPYESFDKLARKKLLGYQDIQVIFLFHGGLLFREGVFHGDIHPGNLLYDPKNKIVYMVDLANVDTIEDHLSQGLLSFFSHLAKKEHELCAQELLNLSTVDIDESQSKKFINSFKQLYEDFHEKTVEERSLSFQMMHTIKLAVLHGVHFPKGMFSVIKSLMYMDGMVLKVAPKSKLATILSDLKTMNS